MNSRHTVRRQQVRAAYLPSPAINWGRNGVLGRSQQHAEPTVWPSPLRIIAIVALGVASWGALIAALVTSGLF